MQQFNACNYRIRHIINSHILTSIYLQKEKIRKTFSPNMLVKYQAHHKWLKGSPTVSPDEYKIWIKKKDYSKTLCRAVIHITQSECQAPGKKPRCSSTDKNQTEKNGTLWHWLSLSVWGTLTSALFSKHQRRSLNGAHSLWVNDEGLI